MPLGLPGPLSPTLQQELMELRAAALVFVGQKMNPPVTDPREVEAWLNEHPDDEPALGETEPFIREIALADSPEAVATAIVRHGENGAEVTQTLKDLYEDTGIPTPGDLTTRPSSG